MRILSALKSAGARIEYLGARLFFALVRILPERAALALGAALGMLFYLALPSRRRVGMQNLQVAFPERTDENRRRILKSSYRNIGRMLVELARFMSMTDEQLLDRVGYTPGSRERYLEASARGKGIMYITGHIGNWELLALSHSLHGHPMRLVARRLDNPLLEAMLNAFRTRGGNSVSERGKGGRRIRDLLAHLRKGGDAGILVDQYARGSNGILVPFFGKLASSHRGPGMLALRTGAALMPAFLRRQPGKAGRYAIHFDAVVPAEDTGDKEKDIEAITTRLQGVLEQEIRSRPEDWFWVHCRWKNSPDLPDLYGDQQKKWRKHRYTGNLDVPVPEQPAAAAVDKK